jgi:hypothetical protein
MRAGKIYVKDLEELNLLEKVGGPRFASLSHSDTIFTTYIGQYCQNNSVSLNMLCQRINSPHVN